VARPLAVKTRAGERQRVAAEPVAPAPSRLQARKQQLVREALASAAWHLFIRNGYESTTVMEIARAAGVSRRTFFRYYASKEGVLVETSDELVEALLDEVARRPAAEPPMVAIRRALEPVLARLLARAEFARGLIRLLRESRTLRRAMLERHARMEERLAALLAERLAIDPGRDSTPALVAFLARAMLDTAANVWYDQDRKDVSGLIDELFSKLAALTRTS
jgi:AcrR family transcriptional regulator